MTLSTNVHRRKRLKDSTLEGICSSTLEERDFQTSRAGLQRARFSGFCRQGSWSHRGVETCPRSRSWETADVGCKPRLLAQSLSRAQVSEYPPSHHHPVQLSQSWTVRMRSLQPACCCPEGTLLLGILLPSSHVSSHGLSSLRLRK